LLGLDIGQVREIVQAFYLDADLLDFTLFTLACLLPMMLSAWRLDSHLWPISGVIGMAAIPAAPFIASHVASYGRIFEKYMLMMAGMSAALALGLILLFGVMTRDRDKTFTALTFCAVGILLASALLPAAAFIELPPWLVATSLLWAWIIVVTACQVFGRRFPKRAVKGSSWTISGQQARAYWHRHITLPLCVAAVFFPIFGWALTLIAWRSAFPKRWQPVAGIAVVAMGTAVAAISNGFPKSLIAATASTPASDERITAEAHFLNWIRPRVRYATTDRPYPLIVVTADGGGLRAAYWSYNVLASLYDAFPSFFSQLYAVSSISGASLGAASFVAAVSAFRPDHTDRCDLLTNRDQCLDSLSQGALSLSQKLQSGNTGGWLSQWAADRFGLTNFAANDRFEDAVLASSPPESRKWLQQSASSADESTPLLILGATDTQTGRPLVAASVKLPVEMAKAGVLDMLASPIPISLLDAAYHSARFPGVSNPARIPNGTGGDWMAVDGGYFDNSGAEMMELYVRMLGRLIQGDNELNGKVKIVVVMLSNKPSNDSRQIIDPRHDTGVLGAVQSLSTMEQVRQRRAAMATARLADTVEGLGGNCVLFDIGETQRPIPVGWALARLSYIEMENALNDLRSWSVDGASRRLAESAGFQIPFAATLPERRPSSCHRPIADR
jgi:hypothetical protein